MGHQQQSLSGIRAMMPTALAFLGGDRTVLEIAIPNRAARFIRSLIW
jgi:hypothetical protein